MSGRGPIQSAETIIDPEGDVVIVAGPTQYRIRVHSVVLRLASKVFRALLGPNFAEGAGLRDNPAGQIYELPLPDDSEDGLVLAMDIVHHRFDDSQCEYFEVEDAFALAVVASKYDLVPAVKATVRTFGPPLLSWTNKSWIDNSFIDDYTYDETTELKILATAYIFRMPDAFCYASNNIICCSHEPLDIIWRAPEAKHLPDSVAWRLSEARNDLRSCILVIQERLGYSRSPNTELQFNYCAQSVALSIQSMIEPLARHTRAALKVKCSEAGLDLDPQTGEVKWICSYSDDLQEQL